MFPGHSERRTLFHESSDFVATKTRAALESQLSVILCVGETEEERNAGKTREVVEAQLDAVIKAVGKTADDWTSVLFSRKCLLLVAHFV